MAASTARRHETGALLRAHLAAASEYRHRTGSCPVCRHLQRLATESEAAAPFAAPHLEPAVTGEAAGAPAPAAAEVRVPAPGAAAERTESVPGPLPETEDEGPAAR
jgi:hypothetical protein